MAATRINGAHFSCGLGTLDHYQSPAGIARAEDHEDAFARRGG